MSFLRQFVPLNDLIWYVLMNIKNVLHLGNKEKDYIYFYNCFRLTLAVK